jgi:hypothetical protein
MKLHQLIIFAIGCASVIIGTAALLVAFCYTIVNIRRKRKQFAAQKKSKALFLSHLTLEQYRCFLMDGWIPVKGNVSGRVYHLFTRSVTMNICCHETYQTYCAYVPNVPEWDNYLAQKLLLECDERYFLRVAGSGTR